MREHQATTRVIRMLVSAMVMLLAFSNGAAAAGGECNSECFDTEHCDGVCTSYGCYNAGGDERCCYPTGGYSCMCSPGHFVWVLNH